MSDREHTKSPRWDRCEACQYPWPCRDALVDQIAAERAARQATEDARDDAQTIANRWYAEAEGLRQQLAALRDWVRQQARARRPDGALCWCKPPDVAAHYPDHGYHCAQARALLTPQEAPANADQEAE